MILTKTTVRRAHAIFYDATLQSIQAIAELFPDLVVRVLPENSDDGFPMLRITKEGYTDGDEVRFGDIVAQSFEYPGIPWVGTVGDVHQRDWVIEEDRSADAASESCTKPETPQVTPRAREPRTWNNLHYVPADVVHVTDVDGHILVRPARGWSAYISNPDSAPWTEVIADA